MDQNEFETIAAKLGVRIAPKRVCSGFENGRLVTIRYYPETCRKPATRFACWYNMDACWYNMDAPRKLIRKRIRVPLELESQWSNEAEFLAILAANSYCEWLSESDLVPGFVAVLSGVSFAYEGTNDNEPAVIVQWRDSRDI